VTFRRQSDTQVQEADAYLNGNEKQSRVIQDIKPVDTMSSDELGKQFGAQALFALGAQLFDQNGSLDKAAEAYN
jgi:hypothetical protein